MEIFKKNIQDSKFNQTRFVFIMVAPAGESVPYSHLFSPAIGYEKMEEKEGGRERWEGREEGEGICIN